MQPEKKVKADPSFYLIDQKIIAFAKFDEHSDLSMFLTDIAESVSKPAHISEYDINETSLLRAKSLGYTADRVLVFLRRYSKNTIGSGLSAFVREVMETQPATKLYLFEEKEKNYYIF